MKFLEGNELTKELKKLVKMKGLRMAVAYWGADGLKLLGLNPNRRDLKVVCCLAGGKSDPDLIKRFGKRAKQNDRLHAKVVWTKSAAIVGSANASSNGLPEEEGMSKGLIEAGALVTDDEQLMAIRKWFDRLYKDDSRPIKKQDLQDARAARKKRIWDQGKGGGGRKKQPLLQAMRDGGKLEFDKQRIFFAFFKDEPTKKELARAKAAIRKNKKVVAKTYQISESDLGDLDYYFDWVNLPSNAFLIDVESWRRGWRASRVFKTFDTNKTWLVPSPDGKSNRVTPARPARQTFPYVIGAEEKAVVRAIGDDLWRRSKGDRTGRVISLKDAAACLLAQSK